MFQDFEVTLLLGQIGKEWREKIPQEVWLASMAKMHRKKMRVVWDEEPMRFWKWQMAGLESSTVPVPLETDGVRWEDVEVRAGVGVRVANRWEELNEDQLRVYMQTNGVRWE